MDEQQVVQTKKPRARYEWIVIAVVLVAAVAIAFGIHSKRDSIKKAELMRLELQGIRSAVNVYKDLNKTNPPSLNDLTKQRYSFQPGDQPRPYLGNVHTSSKGDLVDPFGNPYKYDSRNGWVISATKGYEKW